MNIDDFSRTSAKIPVKRNYFFVCEGENTEVRYLTSLSDKSRYIGLKDNIVIHVYEKKGKEAGQSSPQGILRIAMKYKADLKERNAYAEGTDKMVIIFDLDRLISKKQRVLYNDILNTCSEENIYPAVTNPAFELFLMLHFRNSVENVIIPDNAAIFANKIVRPGKRRYIDKLLSDKYGINAKEKKTFYNEVENVSTAISNEKHDIINNFPADGFNFLTSNIGCLIAEMF